MSKRCHNFGTKRFKEKSLFIFHARIALKSLILLFVRLIARGDRTSTVTLAHARRGLIIYTISAKWVITLNKSCILLTLQILSFAGTHSLQKHKNLNLERIQTHGITISMF